MLSVPSFYNRLTFGKKVDFVLRDLRAYLDGRIASELVVPSIERKGYIFSGLNVDGRSACVSNVSAVRVPGCA